MQNNNLIESYFPVTEVPAIGIPKTGKEIGTISDSQRYKMCGNAVTVDVVEAIYRRLYEK